MERAVLTTLKVALLLGAVLLVVSLPRFAGEYRLSQFTFVAIYFVALLGLNILTGYNGQISLGHGAFMGIGAYTSALLSLGRPGLEFLQLDPPGWLPLGDGMRPVFTIPIAGVVAGVIGFLFGFPALRLARVSLALATFAVAVSLPTVAKRFDELTGGGGGLVLNLPSTPFGLDLSVRDWLYYEAWATAGVLFVVAWLLVRGRVGRAWRALRDGEIAAVSSGVSAAAYKTLAFGVSSAYAGVAGALLAIEVSYVNPDTFPLSLSILLLASVVVGGLASLSGVIFGALLMQFLPIYVQDPPVVSFDFSRQAPSVVFGAILILIMFAVPGGVAGLLQRIVRLITSTLVRRHSPEKGLIVSPGRSEGA
ncbi:MAG: branched-chain amino acid ABC transporter permease [Actinomycetota bacterium]|nr:branched-chain amino acid ABC transporter permease [Actinomycetota bacterium]